MSFCFLSKSLRLTFPIIQHWNSFPLRETAPTPTTHFATFLPSSHCPKRDPPPHLIDNPSSFVMKWRAFFTFTSAVIFLLAFICNSLVGSAGAQFRFQIKTISNGKWDGNRRRKREREKERNAVKSKHKFYIKWWRWNKSFENGNELDPGSKFVLPGEVESHSVYASAHIKKLLSHFIKRNTKSLNMNYLWLLQGLYNMTDNFF
jgi:hypothetical protein